MESECEATNDNTAKVFKIMHTRLLEIIKYKTNGKKSEFAALLGWTPQYLTKLIKGGHFGLNPATTIITSFPEINARWLLTGEGDMITDNNMSIIRKNIYNNMSRILELERYMPVMSSEELRAFEQTATGKKNVDFSPDVVERWSNLLEQREVALNAKFKAANTKSKKICSQKIAKR